MAKESANIYPAARANDAAQELVQLVIEFYRSHRGQFSGADATAVGAEVTAILNGTHKV